MLHVGISEVKCIIKSRFEWCSTTNLISLIDYRYIEQRALFEGC